MPQIVLKSSWKFAGFGFGGAVGCIVNGRSFTLRHCLMLIWKFMAKEGDVDTYNGTKDKGVGVWIDTRENDMVMDPSHSG